MNKFFLFNEYVELGKLFKDCEAYLIALENFNKAMELSSILPINADRLVEAYDLRGKTYMFLGRYIESIGDYSKAIELDPKDTYLYFFRGMAYESLEHNEEALKNFKMSVQLDPKFELAFDMVNYLETK
jgi:tetratricopeptide (TPR) repeat protein